MTTPGVPQHNQPIQPQEGGYPPPTPPDYQQPPQGQPNWGYPPQGYPQPYQQQPPPPGYGYPPQYGYPQPMPQVRQAADRAQYVRQQTGHSLIKHLILGIFVCWINVIYISMSPNHYWRA